MGVVERYSIALRAKNLRLSDHATGAGDIVAAAGMAAVDAPVPMALLRLFESPFNSPEAVQSLTVELAKHLCDKAERENFRPRMKWQRAVMLSGIVLGWYRDSTCRVCGGHGFKVVTGELGEGRAVVGDVPCDECGGSGKRPFDEMFGIEDLYLTRWLVCEMDSMLATAAGELMRRLAPRLEL